MLEAANEGANPSEGVLNITFTKGNREVSVRSIYKDAGSTDVW